MTALVGPIPTFYGNDCAREVDACERLITLGRPALVQLHTWAPAAPAQAIALATGRPAPRLDRVPEGRGP